jgi:hypothetical protein
VGVLAEAHRAVAGMGVIIFFKLARIYTPVLTLKKFKCGPRNL